MSFNKILRESCKEEVSGVDEAIITIINNDKASRQLTVAVRDYYL